MRMKIYQYLVNRHPGIQQRYHRFHDGSTGRKRVFSWCYLLWLNFCYYVLFCRFLGDCPEAEFYEQKQPPLNQSESEMAAKKLPEAEKLVQRLSSYDVISFDIFDTLLFRPFSEPTDLFFFLGEQLHYMDFKRIRMQMEAEARQKCFLQNGHTEITLNDIWNRIQKKTGIPTEKGMELELACEEQFCYANPYMLQVFRALKKQKKKIILISDMYLPEKFLRRLLAKNGFSGMESVYVSCEYQKNKASGSLYELVKSRLPEHTKIIHIGDNPVSDVKMAKKHGFAVFHYPNVNRNSLLYRPYDMSPVIGGAYRGVVNNSLYNGTKVHSMEYEYGFIYGGLFVLGYCNFIHDYYEKEKLDKVLFLSRDGDIIRQVYDMLYPGDSTAYVYWSRAAATKLMAPYDKYDFFRRYFYHKVNQGYTMEQIFASMDLKELLDDLPGTPDRDLVLTDKNVEKTVQFLEKNWDMVLKTYGEQQAAAREYYARILEGCRKACAVDIGWAGSGPVALDFLAEKVWRLPCRITGLIAGTNTIHNAEPDASEMFLQSGKLVSYLYSRSHNCDLMKKHDLNKDYNIFWELLVSSPARQFKGFTRDGQGAVKLSFGEADSNQKGICEIQEGILDFIREYGKHFGEIPYMQRISGRDAYAPVLAASGNGEAYLKAIEKRFHLDIHVS